MKGLLDGTDAYEDPMVGPPQDYRPPGGDFGNNDFTNVLPAGPVAQGRIQGHGGGGQPAFTAGFMQGGGYQNNEGDDAL